MGRGDHQWHAEYRRAAGADDCPSLARNKDFDNPVSAVVIAVSSFIIMMPMRLQLTPVGSDTTVNVTRVLTFANIGSTGISPGADWLALDGAVYRHLAAQGAANITGETCRRRSVNL